MDATISPPTYLVSLSQRGVKLLFALRLAAASVTMIVAPMARARRRGS